VDRIKRLSFEVLDEHKSKFGEDFAENKVALNQVSIIRSKGLKNKVAGYITRFIKKQIREEKFKQDRGVSDSTGIEEQESSLEITESEVEEITLTNEEVEEITLTNKKTETTTPTVEPVEEKTETTTPTVEPVEEKTETTTPTVEPVEEKTETTTPTVEPVEEKTE
jgi:small subunit ribosomal protein S17e